MFHLQVDVVGPLLLNASLLLVLMIDTVTDWCSSLSLLKTDNDVVFRLIRSFNAEKHSILECLCSLLAILVRIIYSCSKIFNGINFFNRD